MNEVKLKPSEIVGRTFKVKDTEEYHVCTSMMNTLFFLGNKGLTIALMEEYMLVGVEMGVTAKGQPLKMVQDWRPVVVDV